MQVEPLVNQERLSISFRRGFLAMIPLWLGVIPFGIAFAVLARTAGFGPWETQALSLFVFAGSSQVAAVTLAATGTPLFVTILAAVLLNLRHVLYGLSISRHLAAAPAEPRPWIPRWLLAFLLTDEAYGLTISSGLRGRAAVGFLLGTGLSLYIVFNLATLVGIWVGGLLPDPAGSGLDVIFPLTFLILLVPLLRARRDLAVALTAALAGPLLAYVLPGGIAILLAALLAIAVGVITERQQ